MPPKKVGLKPPSGSITMLRLTQIYPIKRTFQDTGRFVRTPKILIHNSLIKIVTNKYTFCIVFQRLLPILNNCNSAKPSLKPARLPEFK